MKKVYTIPVKFTGRIEYDIQASSEAEAREKANEMASDEIEFDKLHDIDWEVQETTEVVTIET